MGQGGPLVNAKAVLLVGDDQPQVAKRDLLADEGMGANGQVHLSGGNGLLYGPVFFGGKAAGQQGAAHSGGLQQGGEGLVVLGRQNLCGGHKGRLPAAVHGHPAQSRGHGGFAAAHIPLHQPVHRGGPGHVFYPLGNGPLLGPGELEGQ